MFYRNCDKPIIVFDEIHQLRDPSRLLKIGADVFPKLKILATGSSTLAATRKFSDSLTGRGYKRRLGGLEFFVCDPSGWREHVV